MKATRITVEQRYADDSGVEFGVSFDAEDGTVRIVGRGASHAQFPASQTRWFIDALYKMMQEFPEGTKGT